MAARISKDDFEEKVLKSDLPVIVDFYSDSCVACKKLAPVLGGVEDDYEGRINVYKVNTNFDAELAEKYEVTANPTLLFVKAKVAIEELDDGEVLAISMNDGEPVQNVPRSMKEEGHKILKLEDNEDGTYTLYVRKVEE